MDFTLQGPSLQRLSTISIALQIWKTKRVKEALTQLTTSNDPFKRKHLINEISDMLSEEASPFPLPKILKNQVIEILPIIGFQICQNYDKFLEFELTPDIDIYLDYSNWTPDGIIDEWKVIKSILDEKHSQFEDYTWGCKFCNRQFHPNLCDQTIDYYDQTIDRCFRTIDRYDTRYVALKRYWMNRKVYFAAEFPTAFDNSDRLIGNVFFERFKGDFSQFWVNSSDEKRIGIVKKIPMRSAEWQNVCCRELFFFVIGNLATQHRMEFFRGYSHVVLMQILNDLPRLHLFAEAVELMKDFITAGNPYRFYPLFKTIAEMGTRDFAAVFKCDELFRALWIVSSDPLKRYVIRLHFSLVPLLVLSMDAASIDLMFNSANAYEKRSIVKHVKQTILENVDDYPGGKWDSFVGNLTAKIYD